MWRLSGSELLLWGGIGTMIISVIIGGICTILFFLTGKKLKKKLEQEYGELQR